MAETVVKKRRQPTHCLSCEQAGVRSKRGEGARVVFDPAVQMPGTPTIEGHRLSAEWLAGMLFEHGIKEIKTGWPYLTHNEILVACWWAGTFGPRRFQRVWKEWASEAGSHLWYRCVNMPPPPTRAELAVLPVPEVTDGVRTAPTATEHKDE